MKKDGIIMFIINILGIILITYYYQTTTQLFESLFVIIGYICFFFMISFIHSLFYIKLNEKIKIIFIDTISILYFFLYNFIIDLSKNQFSNSSIYQLVIFYLLPLILIVLFSIIITFFTKRTK